MDMQQTVSAVWRMLAYAYGAIFIIIGIDKGLHTNVVADWPRYISPLAHAVIPLPDSVFLSALGIAEIIVGILFFTRWVRLATLVSIVVLGLVVINLLDLGYGFFDIAARDLLIALGAFAVYRLTAAQGYMLNGKRFGT